MRTITTSDPSAPVRCANSGAGNGFANPDPRRYGGETGTKWVGRNGMTLDVQSDAADA